MIRKYLSSDRVAVRSKLAQKYDKSAENEVIGWIDEMTGVKLDAGIHKLERQLKNGQTLVKLAQRIQNDTENCPEAAKTMLLKLNTENAPFKQMENIQVFLAFCEKFGVPLSGLFHTKDLFDGNNMQQVLACLQQLGTECQRNNFKGPTIGTKPQEKNVREFSQETLKASHSFLAMQAGKGAPSLDFQIGAARGIVDKRTETAKNPSETTPEIINGVPDLLDIGKKKGGLGKDRGEEKKEEGDISEDEMKAKTPPPVKGKPEKKDKTERKDIKDNKKTSENKEKSEEKKEEERESKSRRGSRVKKDEKNEKKERKKSEAETLEGKEKLRKRF